MKKILRMIDLAIRKQGLKPIFYVIGGSDIYGFKSNNGSDTDVRGFHIAPNERFYKISPPKEQIIVNQGNTTQGFESFEDIELVSYELRKFGKLLYKMNFNILEWLFCGKHLINGIPLQIDVLKREILKQLPSCVPYHYLGMAKQNYYKFLNNNKASYRPEAKKFLYVLRGLLAGKNVYNNKTIESDITKLSNHQIIKDLIKEKRKHEKQSLPDYLEARAREAIFVLFEEVANYTKKPPSTNFRDYIDSWMMKVRIKEKLG